MQQTIARPRPEWTCETLGGWRVERQLAVSRWFIVYRAAPASCETDWPPDYAIKCVRPEHVHDNRPRQLLMREKQVSRDVSHPHLATVLDADLEHDLPFIVQPYYEGLTLRRWLERGPVGIARSLWIARQVALALDAMHRGGWIHGDIKPENVIVSCSGHATLIDLGFARRPAAHGCRHNQAALQTTLAYAAPELFQPHSDISSSSDVYSLGVMLYELLAGRHPFPLDDVHEIAHYHLHKEISDIRRSNAKVPLSVSRLVMQMVAKQAEQRIMTSELVRLLVQCEVECFAIL